tara:strand:+ start:1146 stop:1637 length:492 start_codon:yes stop_codon:yes gene_type:complete
MNITNNFMNILNETLNSSFHDEENIKNVATGEFINSLKPHIYKGVNGERCPISFKEFNENTLVITLPCRHIFESATIYRWLTTEKSECPLCRSKFPSCEYKNYNTHIDESAITRAYTHTPLVNMFQQHPYGPTNIERLASVICEDDDIVEIETTLYVLLNSFL